MNDPAFIRGFEGFHNKRFLGFTALAVLVFAIVVTATVGGFRGRRIANSADAMTGVGSSTPTTVPSGSRETSAR